MSICYSAEIDAYKIIRWWFRKTDELVKNPELNPIKQEVPKDEADYGYYDINYKESVLRLLGFNIQN